MNNPRTYGNPPYTVALLHGGPGVSGEMAPVAQELSAQRGILEPLQTVDSLDGQVEELRSILDKHGDDPFTLVGYSWGAWLGFLLAARHPALVKKLILVSSGPLEQKYAAEVRRNRVNRLNWEEQREVLDLQKNLEDPKAFARFGEIMAGTDYYDPLPIKIEGIELRPDIYQGVWPEAKKLRKSGKLLKAAESIQCPVVAIHGDHDPHPAEGVQKPLSKALKNFRFILLEKCGHTPWMEIQARDEFFRVLNEELG
jgi:pimeloyl-ACP methyl ester carboxylesterase